MFAVFLFLQKKLSLIYITFMNVLESVRFGRNEFQLFQIAAQE